MSIDDHFPVVMEFCRDWRTTSEVVDFLSYAPATTKAALTRWEKAGALESLRDVKVAGCPPGKRYRTTAVAAEPGVLSRALRPKQNRLAPPVRAAAAPAVQREPLVPQGLPPVLFDARFTREGVLITFDQFHRLIELLRLTLDGSTNGQAH